MTYILKISYKVVGRSLSGVGMGVNLMYDDNDVDYYDDDDDDDQRGLN